MLCWGLLEKIILPAGEEVYFSDVLCILFLDSYDSFVTPILVIPTLECILLW